MFLSEKTVKNYMTGLLSKLKTGRTEAAIYATKLKAGEAGTNCLDLSAADGPAWPRSIPSSSEFSFEMVCPARRLSWLPSR